MRHTARRYILKQRKYKYMVDQIIDCIQIQKNLIKLFKNTSENIPRLRQFSGISLN